MLLNTINKDGKQDLKFIGIGHVSLEQLVIFMHLKWVQVILLVVDHLSTDGEAKNTGQYNGLWKLLDDEREKLHVTFPLFKSICAVHSTANAYKDLCKSVPEIEHLVKKLSGIKHFSMLPQSALLIWRKLGQKKI